MSDTRSRPATAADSRDALKALARLLARDYARELIDHHLTDGSAPQAPANDAEHGAGQREGLES